MKFTSDVDNRSSFLITSPIVIYEHTTVVIYELYCVKISQGKYFFLTTFVDYLVLLT